MLRAVPSAPDVCGCPDCSGTSAGPAGLAEDLIADGSALLDCEDPLDVELYGANFRSAADLPGDDYLAALNEGIVPAVERFRSTEAVAVLLAIAAVDRGWAAAAAARRLVHAGVPVPSWAGELREPVEAGAFLRFADSEGSMSVLVGTFWRAGRSHGLALNVDHHDCFAATGLLLFPGEVLDDLTDSIQHDDGTPDLKITRSFLDAAEFRWQAERALTARAAHDLESGDPDDPDTTDGPGYHALAELLRARLRTLPDPTRAPAAHGHDPAGPC